MRDITFTFLALENVGKNIWHILRAAKPHFGKFNVPLHLSVPMGFGPAAGWAQAVTDTATLQAGLPEQQRVTFKKPVPRNFPIWGSILDDVWTVEEVPTADDTDEIREAWIAAVTGIWPKMGVAVNEKKSVNGECSIGVGAAEIQGAQMHPTRHWLGSSLGRRTKHMGVNLTLALQAKVTPKDLERAVGLSSFDCLFRTCVRSVFQQVFVDSHTTTAKASHALCDWTPESWLEIVLVTVLTPLAQHSLDSAWTTRLEAYDASPGGHGRAWARLPLETISDMARWIDQASPATNLQGDFGIDVNDAGMCPLRRLRIPYVGHWSCAPRPGGYKHITLEEADARLWSLESSLHRPAEIGTRVLRAGDNAAAVGAAIKGRSPSRPLNARCRRSAALELAGGLCVYDFWVASRENPADAPSSVYGVRAAKPAQPLPTADISIPCVVTQGGAHKRAAALYRT